jgi:predicted ATPase
MKKIVLTGGPCGGKTSVRRLLKQAFREQVTVVKEMATTLLKGGFPVPPPDHPEFEKWQVLFEQAIFPAQIALEDANEMLALPNIQLIVYDRGLLDVDAYAPGCSAGLLHRHDLTRSSILTRYDTVIHLVSLAVSDPVAYGQIGNKHRFETVERATELEHLCLDAWQDHPKRHVINGADDIQAKVDQVFALVRQLLAE